MSQQQLQQRVQLSTASLAIVLCRDEESLSSGVGKFSNPNGYDVFADFKSQNLKSFWNKRLVKAVSEVYFQGWMENFVLLVHGKSSSLEVLRESWMRRALRSPKRFIIRAMGDVSAVHMAPISQSQFIPLSEVLCSVISDMNAGNVVVNQEALIEHLMKHHPGMSIPTQDILYSALGSLIKERKIYHTGEGYFIVTPQTYFITNSLMKDNHKWLIPEKDHPSPPSVTYLVSTETCADTNDFVPSVAHCKSCHCFSQTPAQSAQDQQSISEHSGKGQRCSKETKTLVQHQSTSTAANYRPCEPLTARKDKVCKKFGLNLFRRNISKKEKHKKEYATYSGQFPPEEWPVRDEENLNNLPRDLEHEIIKRINPELTVDNLVRHTIMMKKIEEHRNVISKGTSTEMLATKHRHQSKSIARKVAAKTTKHKKKGHSTKEKQRVKNKLALHRTELGEVIVDGNPESHPEYLHGHLRPEIIEEAELENQICDDPIDIETKNLFKKQIVNPFQGRPVRDAGAGKGLNGHKNREMKGSRTERADKSMQRSKSWDSSRTKVVADNEDIQTVDDRHCKGMKANGLHYDESLDLQPVKECLGDFGSNYPESSTLRIEDKYKLLQNNQPRRNLFSDEPQKDTRYKVVPDGCAAGSLNRRFMARQTEERRVVEQTLHSLPPQVTYQCDAAHLRPEIIEEVELENQICDDPIDIETKNLYKKQIVNPFQGRPVRDAGAGKGLNGHKNREMKGSRTERADKSMQRSKSWDSSRTKVVADNEDIRAVDDRHCKGMKANGLHYDESLDLQPVKECLGDFGSNYPESSTLRIEDKYKLLQNNQPRRNLFSDEPQKDTRYKVVPDGCAAGSLNRGFMARQTEERRVVEQTLHSLPPQVTYQCDAAGMLPPWQRQTTGQRQPSSLLRRINNKGARNQPGNADHLNTTYQQLNNKQSGLIIKSTALQTESSLMGSEVFTDEDQTLYQQAIEDDDACSSLYLNEDSEELESSEDSQSGSVHYQQPYSNASVWHNTAAEDHSASTCENHPAVFGSCYQQEEARWHDSTNRHLANPQNGTRIENSHRPMSQFIYEHLEEKECEVEEADLVDGSIFDFCQTSEADSDAETLHKSADEGDDTYEHWNLDQQTAENQRKQIEKKLELINNTHSAISGQSTQSVPVLGDYSITGDSGIDSPRTRMSLASSNLVILEGLKQRSFLQNLENLHSKSNVILSQNSLLPLTPVINV
ncbi:UNVERIFIED_CONTAM: hypothetical protein FKN15_065793 [Acipenser sinensis]